MESESFLFWFTVITGAIGTVAAIVEILRHRPVTVCLIVAGIASVLAAVALIVHDRRGSDSPPSIQTPGHVTAATDDTVGSAPIQARSAAVAKGSSADASQNTSTASDLTGPRVAAQPRPPEVRPRAEPRFFTPSAEQEEAEFESLVAGIFIKARGYWAVESARILEETARSAKLEDRPKHPNADNYPGTGLFVCLPDGLVFQAEGRESTITLSTVIVSAIYDLQSTKVLRQHYGQR